MDSLLSLFVTIVGVAMSLGYYPQAYRIWRAKSAKDISIVSYCIFSFGTAVWFAYGLYRMDWVIILSFSVGVLGSWLVLALALIYRTPTSPDRSAS